MHEQLQCKLVQFWDILEVMLTTTVLAGVLAALLPLLCVEAFDTLVISIPNNAYLRSAELATGL